MSKKFLLVPLLLISALFTPFITIPPVHAATGVVCLADPSTNSSCPASPPVLAGPVGSLISVGVFVTGSDPMNAFDITLFTNHTYLRGFDGNLAGSVLNSNVGPGQILLLCIDGRLITGPVCSSTDTVGTFHLAANAAVGAPLTGNPTTGVLFTAIFNVTGTTPTGGVTVGFQKGCTQTSVSPDICVTIPNGVTKNVETVQTATFDNANGATMAYVALSANQTSFGPIYPGTANAATLTATAKNGYPSPSAADLVTFTTSPLPSGLTVNLPTTTCATGGTSCSVPLTLTATSVGTYSVTVYATYSTVDSQNNPDTLISAVTFTIVVFDFGFKVSPINTTFDSGTTGTATITLTSLNAWTGVVTFTYQLILLNGVSVSFSRNPVTLVAGATVNSTIIFSSSVSTQTVGHVKVTATSAGRSKSTSPTLGVIVKIGRDFSMTATPSSVPAFISGNSGTSTITVKPVLGLTGTVTLTNKTDSPNIVCSLSPSSIDLSGTQPNSTLTCQASAGGAYIVTVMGTNGTGTHVVFVYFSVQDFAISASPSSVTANVGAQASSTITLTAVQSFSGVVNLVEGVSPSTGLACSLSVNSVTGSGSSTLSCSGSLGTYSVVVNGTSGSLKHSVTVIFIVQDFNITTNPSTVRVEVSASGTSSIKVSSINGFARPVTLSVATNSTSLSCSLSPTTIAGGSGVSILSCKSDIVGNYLATINGNNSALMHNGNVTLHYVAVPDFKILATPTSVLASPGSHANSTITVKALNGFAGTVSLTNSTSAGLSCSLNPKSITLGGSTTSVNSTLSCVASTGSFRVLVSASNATLTRSVNVTITFEDFTLTATSPAAVNVGQSAVSTITVTAVGGLTGTVSLTDTVPSGVTCGAITPSSITLGASPPTATLSCSSSTASNFAVTINGTSSGPILSHIAPVTFSFVDFTISASNPPTGVTVGQLANSTVTVTALNGFSGNVALSYTASSGLACTLAPTSATGSGTATLSCKAATTGSYTVSVTGKSGSLSHDTTLLQVKVWDFSITATTNQLTIFENATGTFAVTLTSVNGFAGTINLDTTVKAGTPVGSPYTGSLPTVTPPTMPVTIDPGASQTITFTVTVDKNAYASIFGIVVNATLGVTHESILFSLTVPQPNISFVSAPASIVVGPGATGHSTLTVTSVNGLHGPVSLILVVPSGASCTLASTSFTLTIGGSASTLLTCTGVVGSYSITIKGLGTEPNGHQISPSGTANFVVADFALSSTPTTILINTLQTGHARITITWQNNLNGNVTLRLVPSSGLNASLEASSLTGSGDVTIDVVSSTANTYSLIVNATSGSSFHTVTLTVNVQGVEKTSDFYSSATFYAIVGVLVAAIVGGLGFLLRRRKPSR